MLFAEHAPVRVHCELLLLWVMRREERVLRLTRTRINQGTRDQWTRREGCERGKRKRRGERANSFQFAEGIYTSLSLMRFATARKTNSVCVRGLDLGSFFLAFSRLCSFAWFQYPLYCPRSHLLFFCSRIMMTNLVFVSSLSLFIKQLKKKVEPGWQEACAWVHVNVCLRVQIDEYQLGR